VRSAHGLAAALAERGHDVHVFTTSVDGPLDLQVPLDRPVDMDRVKVHYFRVSSWRRLYWSPAMGRRLERDMRTFDVVHLHSVYLWPTLKAARCAERAGVPYIVAPRGMLVGDLIRRKSRWVKLAWIRLFEARTLNRAYALHATSATEADEVSALGLKFSREVRVPNGVAVTPNHSQANPLPDHIALGGYVLYLGRINWKKGIERLIGAMQFVPDRVLVIAGNDDENLLPKLRSLSMELGLTDRIHFIGPIDDASKWSLYRDASCFVLPSYSENFGNVVAESLLMACPVVITPGVGLAEFVLEHDAGFVCDGDPASIANRINLLAKESSRRSEMGANGRRAVLQHLAWPTVAARMERAYRDAIESVIR